MLRPTFHFNSRAQWGGGRWAEEDKVILDGHCVVFLSCCVDCLASGTDQSHSKPDAAQDKLGRNEVATDLHADFTTQLFSFVV